MVAATILKVFPRARNEPVVRPGFDIPSNADILRIVGILLFVAAVSGIFSSPVEAQGDDLIDIPFLATNRLEFGRLDNLDLGQDPKTLIPARTEARTTRPG